MALTLSPTQSDIQTALRSFLLSVLPAGTQVVEGQDNRVSEPSGSLFVVMTTIRRERIATGVDAYDSLGQALSVTMPTLLVIQLDVHSADPRSSADAAEIISALFRDVYATTFFASGAYGSATWPPGITPLHADDPRQMPFVNAEKQYETRYVVEAHVQADQTVSGLTQQSALTADVDVVSVTAEFPLYALLATETGSLLSTEAGALIGADP